MKVDDPLFRKVTFAKSERVSREHLLIEEVLRNPDSDTFATFVGKVAGVSICMAIIGRKEVWYLIDGLTCNVYAISPYFDPGPTRPSRANGFVSIVSVLPDAVASIWLDVEDRSSVTLDRENLPAVEFDVFPDPVAWAEPSVADEQANAGRHAWYAAVEAADEGGIALIDSDADCGLLCQRAALALLAASGRSINGIRLPFGLLRLPDTRHIAQAMVGLQHGTRVLPASLDAVWLWLHAAAPAMALPAAGGAVPGDSARDRIAACGRAAAGGDGWNVPGGPIGDADEVLRQHAAERSGYDEPDLSATSCEAFIGLAGASEIEFLGLLKDPNSASEHSGRLSH